MSRVYQFLEKKLVQDTSITLIKFLCLSVCLSSNDHTKILYTPLLLDRLNFEVLGYCGSRLKRHKILKNNNIEDVIL